MSIVVHGFGAPESGALVVSGFGATEADPNAIAAHIYGTSTLSATLAATGDASGPTRDLGGMSRRQRVAFYRSAAATLTIDVSSTATAVATRPTPVPTASAALYAVAVRPEEVTGAASAVLSLTVRSSCMCVRTASMGGLSETAVSARSSAVGEIAWSILDDEDDLFLLLV